MTECHARGSIHLLLASRPIDRSRAMDKSGNMRHRMIDEKFSSLSRLQIMEPGCQKERSKCQIPRSTSY